MLYSYKHFKYLQKEKLRTRTIYETINFSSKCVSNCLPQLTCIIKFCLFLIRAIICPPIKFT